jgi:hypothetical protein
MAASLLNTNVCAVERRTPRRGYRDPRLDHRRRTQFHVVPAVPPRAAGGPDFYRSVDRADEAEAVESHLRQLLSVADDDHPSKLNLG